MDRLTDLLAALIVRLQELYDEEPARVVASTVAVVCFLAAKLGVVLDPQDVAEALGLALLVLAGGEGVRRKVTPADPFPDEGDSGGLGPEARKELARLAKEKA